jgi:hypothetical protein
LIYRNRHQPRRCSHSRQARGSRWKLRCCDGNGKKCKARRLCWVRGSGGGTIQVGGSHIGDRDRYNKAGRGGKGEEQRAGQAVTVNHLHHNSTDLCPVSQCFRDRRVWVETSDNQWRNETMRQLQSCPTRSCDDSTRLDEPKRPEAGLHRRSFGSRLLCLGGLTSPGHWVLGGGLSSTTPENAWAAWFALGTDPCVVLVRPSYWARTTFDPCNKSRRLPPLHTPFRPVCWLLGRLARLPASAEGMCAQSLSHPYMMHCISAITGPPEGIDWCQSESPVASIRAAGAFRDEKRSGAGRPDLVSNGIRVSSYQTQAAAHILGHGQLPLLSMKDE